MHVQDVELQAMITKYTYFSVAYSKIYKCQSIQSTPYFSGLVHVYSLLLCIESKHIRVSINELNLPYVI